MPEFEDGSVGLQAHTLWRIATESQQAEQKKEAVLWGHEIGHLLGLNHVDTSLREQSFWGFLRWRDKIRPDFMESNGSGSTLDEGEFRRLVARAEERRPHETDYLKRGSRANALRELGKKREALALLESLRRDTDGQLSSSVWHDLGVLWLKQGDRQKAEACLNQALVADPLNWWAVDKLFYYIYIPEGRFSRQIDVFRHVSFLYPDLFYNPAMALDVGFFSFFEVDSENCAPLIDCP